MIQVEWLILIVPLAMMLGMASAFVWLLRRRGPWL